MLGGLAGLSGPLPTIWSALRGWSKDERRSILQAYGTAILCFALAAQFAAGILTAELWKLVLIALPGTILGSWIGHRLYNRLDNAKFEKVVLTVLLVSGIGMIAGGVFGKAVG